MSEKDIRKIVCELQAESNQALLDEFHRISIGLRESLTPTHSKLMQEVKDEIGKLRVEISGIQTSVQPAIDAISASRVIGKFTVWLAGVLLAIGGIWIFFKEIVRAAK